jgi:hypothetical protein
VASATGAWQCVRERRAIGLGARNGLQAGSGAGTLFLEAFDQGVEVLEMKRADPRCSACPAQGRRLGSALVDDLDGWVSVVFTDLRSKEVLP